MGKSEKRTGSEWSIVPQPEILTMQRGEYAVFVSEHDDHDCTWEWEIQTEDDDEDDEDPLPWIARGECTADTEDEAKEKAMACALAVLDVLCPEKRG